MEVKSKKKLYYIPTTCMMLHVCCTLCTGRPKVFAIAFLMEEFAIVGMVTHGVPVPSWHTPL